MSKRIRKTQTAGDLVIVTEYTPCNRWDSPKQRAAKRKATSKAQQALNLRHAFQRLELILAANFAPGESWFCTFTYDEEHKPETRSQVTKHWQQFARKLKTTRARREQELKWVRVIENKHGAGRYHAHAVISFANPKDVEELQSLWPHGKIKASRLFDSEHSGGSWEDVARYLTKERPENGKDKTDVGQQLYSCSRNMLQPTIEREWVEADKEINLPADAYVISREDYVNEYGCFRFVKYERRPRPQLTHRATRAPHRTRQRPNWQAYKP